MEWKEKCSDKECWNRKHGHGRSGQGLEKPRRFKAFSDYEHLCNTCDDFEKCECDCEYPYCYKNILIEKVREKIVTPHAIDKLRCDGGCDPSYCWNCVNSRSKKLYLPLETVIHLIEEAERKETTT